MAALEGSSSSSWALFKFHSAVEMVAEEGDSFKVELLLGYLLKTLRKVQGENPQVGLLFPFALYSSAY